MVYRSVGAGNPSERMDRTDLNQCAEESWAQAHFASLEDRREDGLALPQAQSANVDVEGNASALIPSICATTDLRAEREGRGHSALAHPSTCQVNGCSGPRAHTVGPDVLRRKICPPPPDLFSDRRHAQCMKRLGTNHARAVKKLLGCQLKPSSDKGKRA